MKKLAVYLIAFSALLAGLQLGVWLMAPEQKRVEAASFREISTGLLAGFADKEKTHAWLGVPYAAAPVGDLRWKAPRKAEAWEGVLEATEYGSHCMQFANPSVTYNPLAWGEASGSEDCLYLNLWAPAFAKNTVPKGDQRLPVMVWIHGGGNTMGHGGSYDGAVLAGSQQLIVVTINYRMGILGWFRHSALRANTDNPIDASGNYGTLDIIQSLRWVRENIAAFGGDPDNVTVFGESAGGLNTVTMLASPLAKGLFHRAIVQSGVTNSTSLAVAENYADDPVAGSQNSSAEILLHLLKLDGHGEDREALKAHVATMDDQRIADYLRSKSVAEMFTFFPTASFGMYDSPRIFEDGTVIPSNPMIDSFLDSAHYNAVPVITGTNRDEAKMFLMNDASMVETRFGLFKKVIDPQRYEIYNRYRSDAWQALGVDQLAERLSQSQGDTVWTYRFDWDEGGDGFFADYSQVLGAAHSLEVAFVFSQYTGLTMPGVFVDENKASREQLSAQMMSYWAQFAYTGNPGTGRDQDNPRWSARSQENVQSLLFDSAADGGLRMGGGSISFDQLKERLQNEQGLTQQRDRCELYVQMFNGTLMFDEREYLALPGCEGVSAEEFKRW